MITPLYVAVVSGVLVIISSVILWLLNRKLNRAQTEGIIATQYYQLTERLGKERDELLNRIKDNDLRMHNLENTANSNVREIIKLKEDNEECKYLHEVAELEMKQLKLNNDFTKWKRELVFVLDDDEDDLYQFKKKFSKLTVLEYVGYLDVEKFLEDAKVRKPPIIVLDYLLNGNVTANYVLESLGYEPEVFIMSSEKSFSKHFTEKKIRFFHKDDNYILKIAKAIIQHLIHKSSILIP